MPGSLNHWHMAELEKESMYASPEGKPVISYQVLTLLTSLCWSMCKQCFRVAKPYQSAEDNPGALALWSSGAAMSTIQPFPASQTPPS